MSRLSQKFSWPFPSNSSTTAYSFKAGKRDQEGGECQQNSIYTMSHEPESLTTSPQENITLKPQARAVLSLHIR